MGTKETSLTLPETLLNQVETLAQQLNLSPEQLVEQALADLIRRYQSDARVINQGDLYWVYQRESASGVTHPQLVIQDNLFNHSRIHTVVVCALTSNIQKVNLPGNVLLNVGEGKLSRQSVVEVSKVASVAKAQLGDYIGTLSAERVQQVLAGMRFVQSSF